ncbi:MAG: hypothetical protein ACREHG_01990 [Candidatus Saccharimonadales bacterium]
MTLMDKIAAYEDCFEWFDQALNDAFGIRVRFSCQNDAYTFQLRMHQARALHRVESTKIYPETDLRYGKSEYDKLAVRRPVKDQDSCWIVDINRQGGGIVDVQALSELYEQTKST